MICDYGGFLKIDELDTFRGDKNITPDQIAVNHILM